MQWHVLAWLSQSKSCVALLPPVLRAALMPPKPTAKPMPAHVLRRVQKARLRCAQRAAHLNNAPRKHSVLDARPAHRRN
eukprot:11219432-Lingulodinium_polyedra.AAC.1